MKPWSITWQKEGPLLIKEYTSPKNKLFMDQRTGEGAQSNFTRV
ncbi:hypothetical protein [Peribacillus tepidiphilus]|nr:hypothetical protein [Peribacillus tepidiphilus]